ncbi:asparagine synthase (glutamine-hydrolyzing) [candidate division KSB3 bacterium]|uniref:asparagine synthase (glutamine-hydrolyzing) n=1 Tax=candidate division KSB3 bacterium TaxID=2044937 RepID=A0A2G6E7T7_9BACT|nr:MAG: asparagine synthase (glutamine-hydrolyzing) [candidate division KSB3 bacterium]PIE30257.1 MAG: asparagine synthase (glutamine-hydrolyzing) [candidate division KSB3 bacterium]
MCGIAGSLSRRSESIFSVKPAIELLQHRGPDNSGEWHDAHIALGHTRLSILDLSPAGHQPMSCRNARYWTTFNGEIYNFIELRQELLALGCTFDGQSDTEVLVAAYAQWGKACLEKLRGMFAFGIWDRTRQRLFLARDRVGEKPLYYWYDEEYFCFASELRALLALLPHRPCLDPAAIDLYLHYQYVPEPKTPLHGIHKLSAAHCLSIAPASWQIQMTAYWDLEQIEALEGKPTELIGEELDRALPLSLRSDVPIGIALSGGLDSGAIAALAAPRCRDTLQAFSVGYPGHPPYDERRQAEKLAKLLKIPFHAVELLTEDFVDFFPTLIAMTNDPIADIAAYGHYAVMKLASDHGLKVMLSGHGGDELFWGYPWVVKAVQLTERKRRSAERPIFPQYVWKLIESLGQHRIYQRLSQSGKVPAYLRTLLQKGFEFSRLSPSSSSLVFYDMLADFRNGLNYCRNIYSPAFQEQIPDRNAWQPFDSREHDHLPPPLRICDVLMKTWLVSNCLALGDRLSMASSVETRIPLLDYKLIEVVTGLRKSHADHNLGPKFWLKSLLKGIVPDELLTRPKRGFEPPAREWMQAVLHRYEKLLLSGSLLELQVLSSDAVDRLYTEFRTRQKHIFFLYKLLVLEIWYRTVVLQEALCV